MTDIEHEQAPPSIVDTLRRNRLADLSRHDLESMVLDLEWLLLDTNKELRIAYENLSAVHERCSGLLEANRTLTKSLRRCSQ